MTGLKQRPHFIFIRSILHIYVSSTPHTLVPGHHVVPSPSPPPHPQALFIKYYDTVMPLLSSILVNATDKTHRLLRAKALECISLVAMVSSEGGWVGGWEETRERGRGGRARGWDGERGAGEREM